MVSSGSYGSNQYNLAAQGHRQAGSTFKAFVLTTAIKQGIDPYSTYYTSKPLDLDLPEWGHWEVHTADEGYQGTINLQQATVASDNTVFAQLDLDVGPENVAETAKSMGITSPLDGIPAEGLGGLRIGVSPLEMSDAYATLADGGVHRNPVAIRKVEFPTGRVDHPEEADPKRVLPENVAYEVTRILHDNITYGTGTAAYTGCYGQAGKTGTVDNYTDAWFMGYQPNLSTGVWVGYPQSNAIEMTSVHGITVFGGTFPAEIWHAFYTNAGIPCEDFPVPSEPIDWSSFFGSYTSSEPSNYDYSTYSNGATGGTTPKKGGGGDKSYDPNLYAPGAGQEPAPPPPSPPPAPPSPPAGGGGGGGGRQHRRRPADRRRRRGRLADAGAGRLLRPHRVGDRGGAAGGAGPSPGPRRGRRRSRLAARRLRRRPRRQRRRLLRVPLARLHLLPRRPAGSHGARRAPALGSDHRPRHRLRAGTPAALAGRLQLHLLRPARRRARAQPLHPRALRHPGDPAFPFVGWRDASSAYGPLFTLLSYPLAWSRCRPPSGR